jgi:hypothetical protein
MNIEHISDRLTIIEEDQKAILKTVTELKFSICGSDKIGFEGMMKKVERHEKYIEDDKKTNFVIAGGIAVVTFIAGILVSLWDKIFK